MMISIQRRIPLRYVLLFIIVVVANFSYAQDGACIDAVQQAYDLIEAAQQSLNAGNINTANGQLEDAKTRLTDCEDSDTGEAISATGDQLTDVPEPTQAAEPTESVVSGAETAEPGNFMINAPDVNPEQGVTFIRFAHTSIDAGAIDIYLGNGDVPVVENLQYGEVTGFVAMNIGSLTFVTRAAGSDNELYRVNWNFVGNSSWIITAAGLADEFAFIVEPISVIRNQYNGQARVRVVNLLAGVVRASVVDVDSGLNLGDGLGWIGIKDSLVPPGSYTLQISPQGYESTEPQVFDFADNTTYTLYLIGNPGGEPAVSFINMVANEDSSRIRFINQRSDTVDIHYRPGNDLITGGLASGVTTEYSTIAAGAVTFVAYAPGTGPTGQELAALPLQLRPGRDLTITLTSSGMSVTERILNP